MNVQMQAGANDCGLFAIAFATAVVFVEKPGDTFFNQHELRKHLHKCFVYDNISCETYQTLKPDCETNRVSASALHMQNARTSRFTVD